MHSSQKSSDRPVATIGIDIGKNTSSVPTSAAPSCCEPRYHAAMRTLQPPE